MKSILEIKGVTKLSSEAKKSIKGGSPTWECHWEDDDGGSHYIVGDSSGARHDGPNGSSEISEGQGLILCQQNGMYADYA